MELFDLYTKDREKTGFTMERGQKLPKDRYRLVVHICIFNSKGAMLIQQRQPFKAGWPDMWDVSVGGSAIAGESSQTAAEREVLEEIGCEILLEHNRPVLTTHFDDGFDDVYTVEKDLNIETLVLQPEEVKAVKWAALEEVLQMIDEGLFIPYHKDFIRLLFYMKNHRGTFHK